MFRSLIAIAFFSLPLAASALPLPKPYSTQSIPETFTTDYNFEGIVSLSNCSGSLIQFENSKPTDDAKVLTNGHCLETGMPKPGEVFHDQPSSRSFGLMDATASTVGNLQATKVIYSTMTNTDITLYQLSETYEQILSQYNVHPFTLSSQHPALNTPIDVVSGYWRRGYSCNIEAFVPQLKEDSWTWMDSVRYSRPGCEVIGGTSGSPIIARGTRNVIAINNTINEDNERCTLDNPCEVDNNGNVTYHQGYGYGQETYLLSTCINSAGEFDLTVDGCQLPK